MSIEEKPTPAFVPSARLADAFRLAATLHAGQVRKGTRVPYLSHLMGVASLVMDHGGDEDQTIAALLHDAYEDIGQHVEAEVRNKFGKRVADIVQACTDGVPDESGNKLDWQQRKEAYIAHLRSVRADALLVSGCDKLHNARAILSDLESVGPAVFDRFKGKREGTLRNYRSLSQVFSTRLPGSPLARELQATVEMIELRAR